MRNSKLIGIPLNFPTHTADEREETASERFADGYSSRQPWGEAEMKLQRERKIEIIHHSTVCVFRAIVVDDVKSSPSSFFLPNLKAFRVWERNFKNSKCSLILCHVRSERAVVLFILFIILRILLEASAALRKRRMRKSFSSNPQSTHCLHHSLSILFKFLFIITVRSLVKSLQIVVILQRKNNVQSSCCSNER